MDRVSFLFFFGHSVFLNQEVIVMHIQQGTILGKLGFCAFVAERHLILQSLPPSSNVFVDQIFRHGVVVISNFSFQIASNWVFWRLNSTPFLSRVQKEEVTSARFGMNFPKSVIMPKNCCNSFTEFGNGIIVVAPVFAGITFTLLDYIICLRNTMVFTKIWHLFLIKLRLSILLKNLFKKTKYFMILHVISFL